MKYCPKCGDEFIDDVAVCADCNYALVDEVAWRKIIADRRHEDEELFIKVAVVNDQFEADVLKGALEKEQIPVLVRSYQDTSFNGLYVAQKGWGIIEVPEEFRVQAKAVIDAIAAAQPET